MGILNASQGFGSAVGPMLYGAVTEAFDFSYMFITGGFAGVVPIPLIAYCARQARRARTARAVVFEEIKPVK